MFFTALTLGKTCQLFGYGERWRDVTVKGLVPNIGLRCLDTIYRSNMA